MLIEKKIQIDELTRKRTEIVVSGITYKNGVVTITAPNQNVIPGATLFFERSCGDGDVFVRGFNVYDVDKDKNNFKINYNIENYCLQPRLFQKVNERIDATTSGNSEYLLVNFENRNKHICCKDRSDVNLRYLFPSDYTFGGATNNCKAIDVLFNNTTYYRTNKKDDEGNWVLEQEGEGNINNHYVWFNGENGEKISLGDAFVPLSPNGYDNRSAMFFEWSDAAEFLYENFKSKALFCFDCRFFNLDGVSAITEEINLDLAEGTRVYTYSESLNLQIGLTDDFRLDLTHEDDIISFMDEEAESKVSGIIDFEKRMFEPVFRTSSDFRNVKSIRFNVFLRDRTFNEETGDWDTDDTKYWYSLDKGTDGRGIFKNDLYNSDKGDLLGNIGFTDDDVMNQSERLKKSFIRLSFYDSTDRATQSLLYYSTVFMNVPKQYAKYMKNITYGNKMEEGQEYVSTPNIDDDLALCCNFTVYDKFNMSGSSEGFYLYLFPDIVTGLKETELYMKVEFNHAKYGKTIPLVWPLNSSGETSEPLLNYLYSKLDTQTRQRINYVNLDKFYQDMYIRVKVQRDDKNNRYVWFLPYNSSSNEIVFNLFEPRINESRINR